MYVYIYALTLSATLRSSVMTSAPTDTHIHTHTHKHKYIYIFIYIYPHPLSDASQKRHNFRPDGARVVHEPLVVDDCEHLQPNRAGHLRGTPWFDINLGVHYVSVYLSC